MSNICLKNEHVSIVNVNYFILRKTYREVRIVFRRSLLTLAPFSFNRFITFVLSIEIKKKKLFNLNLSSNYKNKISIGNCLCLCINHTIYDSQF